MGKALILNVALQVGARLIDNLLTPDANKPQFGNLVQTSSYGAAMNRLWGPECRIAGSIIDISPKPKKHTSKNVLKKVISKGSAGKTTTYGVDVAIFLADTAVRPCSSLLKVWAQGTVIFDATKTSGTVGPQGEVTYTGGWKSGFCDSMVFYPGNFTQLADPTLEAIHGVGEVPGYRGSCYVVIKQLNLTMFGNNLPNLNFLIEQQASISLAQVLADICDAAGVDPGSVSLSGLGGLTVRGYVVGTTASAAQAISPLAMAYDFDAAEVAGSLRFVPRGTPPQATVLLEWFDGHEGGAIGKTNSQPYAFTREDTTKLPDSASITYSDPARDYQSNVAGDRRKHGQSQNLLSATLPVVLTETEAIKIADRSLWEPITAAQGFKATSDDRLLWLEPSKTFAVSGPNAVDTYRPKLVQRGANRLINVDAVAERALVYASPNEGAPAPSPANEVRISGPINPPIIVEAPLILTANLPTLWLAVSGGDGTTFDPDWSGCDVYVSTDDSNFYNIGSIPASGAVQGKLTGNLAAFAGANPDTVHTLAVSTLESGNDPASVSASDAARYTPLSWADGEWLSFETATMTGDHAFDLTTALYRGLYGTAPGAHLAGTGFAVFDSRAFPFKLPPEMVGITLYFRFPVAGADLSTTTTYTYNPSGLFDFYQPAAGFGINETGLVSSDPLLLGTALWSKDVTFDDADPGTHFTIESAPTSSAAYTMKNGSGAVVGTITIPAGDHGAGRVAAWTGSPYKHPAGEPMKVYRPSPDDATLGGVSAIVTGRLLD